MAVNSKPEDPHPVDEDPEDHLGEEIDDPWDDLDENGAWKDAIAATESHFVSTDTEVKK